VGDHSRTSAQEQARDLACGGRPIEPMPALACADHVKRAARQASRLRRSLDVGALHAGLTVQAPRLLKQRSGNVHSCHLAPAVGEQAREAPGTRAEIHNTCARPADTARREAIEQLHGKSGTVTRVIRRGATEIGLTRDHTRQLTLPQNAFRASTPV
jgi:hypothetical protein